MILLLACAQPAPTAETGGVDSTPSTPSHEEVGDLLSGRFDSQDQADADASYYAISLVTCAVDAPELGEVVLYVEQASMDTPDAPYRQRLYVVTQEGEAVRSTIYELDRPKKAVGLCDEAERGSYAAEDVVLREGCDVLLERDDAGWTGTTQSESCPSSLGGASWATSAVTLRADRIESWDQGWDAQGDQVWGATDGAYVFLRRE